MSAENNEAKVASLAIASTTILVSVVLSVMDISPCAYGIGGGMPWWHMLSYHMFHANILHAVLNSYCLLSIVFLMGENLRHIILSYIIASTYPVSVIHYLSGIDAVTVGMSGMCFAMLGIASWRSTAKMRYHLWIFGFISLGVAIPWVMSALMGKDVAHLDNPLHIYTYAIGVLTGYIERCIGKRA